MSWKFKLTTVKSLKLTFWVLALHSDDLVANTKLPVVLSHRCNTTFTLCLLLPTHSPTLTVGLEQVKGYLGLPFFLPLAKKTRKFLQAAPQVMYSSDWGEFYLGRGKNYLLFRSNCLITYRVFQNSMPFFEHGEKNCLLNCLFMKPSKSITHVFHGQFQ